MLIVRKHQQLQQYMAKINQNQDLPPPDFAVAGYPEERNDSGVELGQHFVDPGETGHS
jgi:hypothetical protein